MKRVIGLLLIFLVAACQPRPPEKVRGQGEDKGPHSSDTLSKWVRSNAAHFWSEMRTGSGLEPYLQFQGVIAGDPHLANFGWAAVSLANGERALRYLNVDFDDAGRGPFVLDFLRLVTTTRATQRKVATTLMVDAYIRGLAGDEMPMPPELTEWDLPRYEAKALKEIGQHTKGDRLVKGEAAVERYDGPIKLDEVASLLPEAKLLDLARRLVDEGGSRGGLRLWVLGKASGQPRLYELKEFRAPAVASYASQPERSAWLAEIQAAFWPGIDPRGYTLNEIQGKAYWIREKRPPVIDIPYANDKKAAVALVRHLAEYDAYLLGRAHGRQSPELAHLLDDPDEHQAFAGAIHAAAIQYLRKAEGLAVDGSTSK